MLERMGAAEAIGLQALLLDMGLRVKIRMWQDASAARAFASRKGLGNLRHINAKCCWRQKVVREGRVELLKIGGDVNRRISSQAKHCSGISEA
jgi:hypothetical protein